MLIHLIAQHAEDAAFYWSQYFAGARSSQHDAASLRRMAQLIDANLEGLRVADQESGGARTGMRLALARMEKWKTPDEVFAASVLAIEADDRETLAVIEALAAADDGVEEERAARGLASAAAWLPWPQVRTVVSRWSGAAEPLLRRCAVAAAALQRLHGDEPLLRWFGDASPLVAARAMRAAGEVGTAALIAPLIEAVSPAAATEVRLWAGWSLCLLGRSEGVNPLGEWIAANPDHARAETFMAALVQAMPAELLDAAVVQSLRSPKSRRAALAAIRYSGDCRHVPALLDLIEQETTPQALAHYAQAPRGNHARLAADVIAHITGIQIGDGAWMSAPEEDDSVHLSAAERDDADQGLLWPDATALRERWAQWQQQGVRRAAQRCIAGLPLGVETAHAVLADPDCTQRQRHHAALLLRRHGAPALPDVANPQLLPH